MAVARLDAATASSHTRSVRVTSPKSITPHGISRPARSRRPITFQSVTSQCTIWLRQPRREPLDGLGRRARDSGDELAPARVLDVRRERLDDRADVAGIPLHRAVGGGVLEVLERARDQARDLAERAEHGRREVLASIRGSPSMNVTRRSR